MQVLRQVVWSLRQVKGKWGSVIWGHGGVPGVEVVEAEPHLLTQSVGLRACRTTQLLLSHLSVNTQQWFSHLTAFYQNKVNYRWLRKSDSWFWLPSPYKLWIESWQIITQKWWVTDEDLHTLTNTHNHTHKSFLIFFFSVLNQHIDFFWSVLPVRTGFHPVGSFNNIFEGRKLVRTEVSKIQADLGNS